MKTTTTHLKILVLSQDSSLLQLLKILLTKTGINRIAISRSAEEALHQYHEDTPDVCMLEVKHEQYTANGIEMATQLRDAGAETPIIFLVPSYDQSLYNKLQKFSKSTILSKELSSIKLNQAFENVRLQLEINKLSSELKASKFKEQASVHSADSLSSASHIFFRIGDSFRRVDKKEVSYFFAEDRLVYAQMGERKFPTNVQLKSIEEELFPNFLRCHKKYIVNTTKIDAILLKEGKVKIQDKLLAIGYRYRKSFLNNINILK